MPWSCLSTSIAFTLTSRSQSMHCWQIHPSCSSLDVSTSPQQLRSTPWLERVLFCNRFHLSSLLRCFFTVDARRLTYLLIDDSDLGCLVGWLTLWRLLLGSWRWFSIVFLLRCLLPAAIWVSCLLSWWEWKTDMFRLFGRCHWCHGNFHSDQLVYPRTQTLPGTASSCWAHAGGGLGKATHMYPCIEFRVTW